MTFTIILSCIFILSAIICHNLAKKYDARPAFWGTMGLVFGPFAIMLLAYLSKKLRNNYKV